MVRVLLERNYNPPLTPQPMTAEYWIRRHESYESCLQARDIKGIGSFVALDGTRSICVLEASYAQAVREATREAKVAFKRVWRAEVSSRFTDEKEMTCSDPVVAEVSYNPPLTKEQWEQFQQKFQPNWQGLEVRHLVSYLASTGEHGVDIFAAPNAKTICNLYRKLGLVFDFVWESRLLLEVSD